MPHKQRKSIISTRGQKPKQGEAHNAIPHTPRNSTRLASDIDNQGTETDGLDQLRQQVRQIMESQGQMMGMIQGALRNQLMAVPTGPGRA